MYIPADRILILDGAMGTMIQKYAPAGDGNNEMLNLVLPDVISRIHEEYIEAGADIIETNTFSANRISQQEYGLSDKAAEMAFAGASIARKVADRLSTPARKILVAGSVGPTSKSLSLASDASDPAFRQIGFDELSAAYEEQIDALARGGADIILLETCFDALNAKAAIYAMCRLFPKRDFPLMVSVSVSDRSGRTLTGQTIEAFYTSIKHYPLLSFGLNCSLGAAGMTSLMQETANFAECALSCYPNAGLPNELGKYDETPAQMAADMKTMASKGLLNIAGGCCGTTPDHIRAISAALKDISPRPLPKPSEKLVVSGLEAWKIDAAERMFTPIGERANVAGSRKFARLIAGGQYEEALGIASAQIDNGACVIDINMDDAMLDSTKEMTVFTRHISGAPEAARAALMIDSSHFATILAGLKNTQGKSIVNSISLKDGEEEFVRRAKEINALGAAMVVMAFDEEGQATEYERKIRIAERAYRLLTEKAGIPPHDIIFDVNVLTIATGLPEHARYAVDFIEAVRWIKANLPGALTSGGISNLSFAFRGNNKVREAMHSVFLYHAIRAGLDMAIVNPGMIEVYDNIGPALRECIEDVIFDRRSDATERLTALAGKIAEENAGKQETAAEKIRETGSTPAERVRNALIKGSAAGLHDDLMALMESEGSAVNVIEGPLMSAMETVGDWFGQGKMFLPQVVKSAMAMKEAVAILQPYMDTDTDKTSSGRPKIVIATVKGDVHDIGKNITGIVLRCNGFDVIDLGVMVETKDILDKAEEAGADIVAVSGLITPSLFRMEEICREMTARGMDKPLFVGGATTSALHTAVKLAPLYHKVFHGSDASASAVMAKKYIMDSEKFTEEEHEAQERLRQLHAGKKAAETAPAPDFPAGSFVREGDIDLLSVPACTIPAGNLMEFFDWKLFFLICGIKDTASGEAEALRREATERLADMPGLKISAALELYSAYSDGNTIFMEKDGEKFSMPMLRQEEAMTLKDGRKACLSLSDFVPDKSLGFRSVCGIFATSAVSGQQEDLTGQAILDTLAEAASAYIEHKISGALRRKDAKVIMPAAGYACFPDHSAKKDILSRLKNSASLGITLTESFGMSPDASICGMVFMHPEACYPDIRAVGQKQWDDYVGLRHIDAHTAKVILGHLLQ